MSNNGDGYVPILSYNLLHPVAALWEDLEKASTGKSNGVQVACLENGYATATCALIVLFMESVLSRTRYILHSRGVVNLQQKTSVVDFFDGFCTDRELARAVSEAFVLRDVIVHNHVWDCEIESTDQGLRFIKTPVLLPGFGDKKFRESVDLTVRKTKTQALNVFPTRIEMRDARKVLRIAYKMTKYLEAKDRYYCYIGHMPVMFRDKGMTFEEFVMIANGETRLEDLGKGEIAELEP